MSAEHPMVKHIPSITELHHILEDFSVGDLLSVESELGGLFNSNLKIITQNGLYVVRILSGFARSRHIAYEQIVVKKLLENGIPAIRMEKSQFGTYFTRWKGRKVQVSRYYEGEEFSFEPRQIHSSGAILRKIHHALKHLGDGPKPKWSNYPSFRVMQKGIQALENLQGGVTQSQIKLVKYYYDKVVRQWAHLNHNLPITVLHGDWHLWNQLYTTKGEVSLVFDFDFVQRGYRIFDVGDALWILCLHESSRPYAAEFLRGYGSIRPTEQRVLRYAIARASLFALCTVSLLNEPVDQFKLIYPREIAFLHWILSEDGKSTVSEWLK
jgi:Ser/Thr protein kinase RdoA (MazF antagonist)